MKAYILVLRYHGAGFFSIFNKLMNYLQFYNPIYKIVWDVINPWNHYGPGEMMSKAFEDYENPEYKDYEIETIICENYINNELTGQQACRLYTEEGCKEGNISLEWRKQLYDMFTKYAKIKQPILDEFERFKSQLNSNGKKIVTMLIRHPYTPNEQPNARDPTFSQFEDELKKISPNLDDIFVICMTDHVEAYEYFNQRYSHMMIFPSVDRTPTSSGEAHNSRERNNNAVNEAVLSILYLTLGEHFIHATSNMSTAVLYFNPNIKNHFVIG